MDETSLDTSRRTAQRKMILAREVAQKRVRRTIVLKELELEILQRGFVIGYL